MKKIFILLILSCFVMHSEAQWKTQAVGFPRYRAVNQIVPVSKNVVWATASDEDANPAIAGRDYCRTTDGGDTWTIGRVSAAPASYLWSNMTAVDENTAWAMFWDDTLLSTGGIYKTTDGGA